MSQHFHIWQNWYRQQSMPPPLHWSDAPMTHNGQSAWVTEATLNGRVVARSVASSKSTAQNECARQLLIFFRVPHN
ncbi:unnamed protein product [Rhizoctonia solani]|uniref:DRBM domain-containing protein n=1 Tax=Rhizoctonia solani TaxID=456999 RepID=A0A8H3GKK7_9AGAM|nr:unnamed protein product [Rhizoctonia solani]